MMKRMKKQIVVFFFLLLVYAIITFAAVALELEQLTPGGDVPMPVSTMPGWILGLANAAIVIVIYGLVGGIGLVFAKQLGIPGIYREKSAPRDLAWIPFVIGFGVGVALMIADILFSRLAEMPGFPHPPFPLSILASGAAGIGEEIMFRMFMLGFWAWILNLALKRWMATRAALWIANVVAAVFFAASHIPSAMFLLGVSTPGALPAAVIIELLALNGLLGIVAGELYVRNGLVAAAGVHFWADVVWHVIFPLFK
jgi:membrane protease YdiL (CAAX protease family)